MLPINWRIKLFTNHKIFITFSKRLRHATCVVWFCSLALKTTFSNCGMTFFFFQRGYFVCFIFWQWNTHWALVHYDYVLVVTYAMPCAQCLPSLREKFFGETYLKSWMRIFLHTPWEVVSKNNLSHYLIMTQ